jgi:K(+)-stimulated pyrophosphate-energized sodium pump
MIELGLIFVAGVLGLAFAGYLARWVLGRPAGEGDAPKIAAVVRAIAEGFLRKQSSTIGAVSAALGSAIFLAYGLLRRAGEGYPVPALELGVWLTLSFALGAAGSIATGQVATWAVTRTSARAAAAAARSTDLALQIAIRGGAVSGLFLAAAGLLGLAGLFTAVFAYKGGFGAEPAAALKLAPAIPLMIAGFGLGASFASLLAQLGGGTFAKAADLGADLAGRDVGLGEDDRNNPATVVDLAGDAVGDGAGRASGLFESTVAECLGAMIVGGALYRDNPSLKSALSILLFPLVTFAFGLVAAMFGVMVVRTDDREDPKSALVRGFYVTAVLHAVSLAGAAKWLLGAHWLTFFGAGAAGVAAGVAFLLLTQYYTEQRHRPVRELAEASRAGATANVLHGLALGLESTVAPFAAAALAMLGAYHLGARSGLAHGGLFGTAVATMGMLGTAAYVLTMDAFGPILDNAGGIVAMTVARDRPDIRGRTMVLDGVGNAVKALTKAYAAGAAAIASLLLVAAFVDESRRRLSALGGPGGKVGAPGGLPAGLAVRAPVLPLDRPEVYLGALVGIVLVLWVISRCLFGVVRAARRVADEARRQLRDRPPGFVPDPEACVEPASRVALRQMIAPAVVAAVAPLGVALGLHFARTEDNPLAIADSVAALTMAGTIAGVLGALLLGNAGGAWDNAKKYIATGAHGGRHLVDESGARVDNPTYGAALVGDTVGDPLKDIAAPAMHVLAKMLPMVTIVFLPFFL